MKKCNIGCGSIQPAGWHNVDIQNMGQEYIGGSGLFHVDEFDIVVAHCFLQMIEWHRVIAELSGLKRILKPGGVLRISLPDIEEGFKQYKLNNIDWFPNSEDDLAIRFSAWLTWYSTTKTLLTATACMAKLEDAGFGVAMKVDYKETWFLRDTELGRDIVSLDTRQHECYFIEAKKII